MNNPFLQFLKTEDYILLDGATGTILMGMGLASGAPPEEWNRLYPERIVKMHEGYVNAGSQVILTNSFGGTHFRLKLHNMQDQVHELNRLAAVNARQAADAVERTVVVAGSIGPSGELFAPMGEMTFASAVEAFAEQARGLAEGGVDIFWVETMSDLKEVEAAVKGARSVSDLPICATMTFDTKGYTMMGVSPQQAIETMSQWGLAALGANCGNGCDEVEGVIAEMHKINPHVPLIAKSNAGIPEWINNELHYNGTPEVMAEYAQRIRYLGARLIGGCCGNGPAHIAAMDKALKQAPLMDTVVARGFTYTNGTNGSNGSEKTDRKRRRRREK